MLPPAWQAFLSTIFDDLDVSRRGLVPLKHALIALALMLGDTPLELGTINSAGTLGMAGLDVFVGFI